MPTPPILDPRRAEDLVERLRRLAVGIPEAPGFVFGEWAGRDDAGMVLVRIFARMMELALERLNLVPEKNLLAFLDMMGVGLMPPAMARVPLTFTLAKTGGAAGLLPRGTQVATLPTDTAPAVVFETEDDLIVHASRLVAAWSIDPVNQRFGERTGTVTGSESAAFPAFGGERAIEHAFYVGGGALFAGNAPRLLTLALSLPRGGVGGTRPPWETLGTSILPAGGTGSTALRHLLDNVTWEAWRGGRWEEVDDPVRAVGAASVTLVFPVFTGADELEIAGAGLAQPLRDRWLRARLTAPFGEVFDDTHFPEASRVGEVAGIVMRAWSGQADEGNPLAPDLVQVNTAAVDASGPFAAFGEAPRPGDTLYVASTEALTAPVPDGSADPDTKLIVTLDHGDADVRWEAAVWSYDAEAKESLGVIIGGGDNGEPLWFPVAVNPRPTVAALSEPGRVELLLPRPPDPGASHALYLLRATVRGGSHRRPPAVRTVALDPPPDPGQGGTLALLAGREAEGVIRFGRNAPALPETLETWITSLGTTRVAEGDFAKTAWSVITPTDPAGPLMPFGSAPVPGSVFHLLHLRRADTQPSELSFASAAQTVRLAWEYHGAGGWTALGGSTVSGASTGWVDDGTNAFTRSGEVRFPRMGDAMPVEVNGRAGHWLRVRIASGDFGRGVEYAPVDPADASKGVRVVPGTALLGGPVIESLALGYSAATPRLGMAAHSHLEWRDLQVGEPRAGVAPFLPVPEPRPALYLGFDQPFAERPVSLYLSVPTRQLVELEKPPVRPVDPDAETGEETESDVEVHSRVAWEYWNGAAWAPLPVVDDTRSLTESGTVQFPGPADLAQRQQVEAQPRYWVRARLVEAAPGYTAFLRGVHANTVRAVQGATVSGELLGSSNGRPGQAFRLARAPVQPGQVVRVREPERPSPADVERLEAESGPGAVLERPGARGETEYWVRWTEVPTALVSDPLGRHYTIDRASGVIRFGDGVRGMVPPLGRDNLVVERYLAGGGASGNQRAGAVRQLRSAFPYISGAFNSEASDGGADGESLGDVMLRGPQALRHRGRAVAADDYEWLAREAAGNRIARARALPTRDRRLRSAAGNVTLVLVPRSPDPRPFPTGELVRQVEDFFAERAPTALVGSDPARVSFVGPGYVPVALEVRVRAVSLGIADAVRQRVSERLDAFLHPLLGGPDGTGWAFGRDAYISEIFAALESVEGVEHVVSAGFRPGAATVPLLLADPPVIPRGGVPAGTRVALLATGTTPVLTGRLAEALEGDVAAAGLMLILFQEGEGISMRGENGDLLEAVVRRITLDTLEVDAFVATDDFPAVDTTIVSTDGVVSARLAAPIRRGERVEALPVFGVLTTTRAVLDPTEAPGVPELELRLDRPAAEGGVPLLGDRLRVGPASLPYSGAHTVSLDYAAG